MSKYKLGFITLTIITALSSCKKSFVELTPPTSVPISQATGTEADLQVALRGAYAGLRGVDYYGRTFPVLGDVLSDNTYVSAANSNRYIVFNNLMFTLADGNVSGLWNTAYSTILRCNNIINSALSGTTNVSQYKGEAYAIRALCYFDLVRFFARPYSDDPAGLGVPIVTTYDPNFYPTRSSIAQVYTQIINDLSQAYSLMTVYTNSTQFSKYAAKGLQAKIYLNMGDLTNAKTAALDVINNSGFSVVPAASYVAFWNVALPRTDKVETLFEVSSDAVANNGFDGLANIYSQSGYGDLLASPDLYASYGTTDVRRGLYSTGTRSGVASIFVNKYPNTYGGDISDTKVLRMSEIYFIAAEASYPSNETDVKTYLNYITSRRNADAVTATGSALFEAVITERRKELAFEGDRYHVLQRLKRDIARYTATGTLTIPYSNFRRVLPIPQTEIDANINIRSQQNPGY